MAGVGAAVSGPRLGETAVSPYQSCYWDLVCSSSTQKSPNFNMICESNVFIHFTDTHWDLSLGSAVVFNACSRSLLLIWKMNRHPSPSALVDVSIFPAGTFCIHPLFIFMSFPVTLTDKISSKHDATPTTIYHSQNSLYWPNKLHLPRNFDIVVCSNKQTCHIRYFWYDII